MNLDELNARHGTAFTLTRGYDGGEFGAQRLLDDAGCAWVFKQQPAGLAPMTTEALRRHGYPAPRYLLVGENYSVQEELPELRAYVTERIGEEGLSAYLAHMAIRQAEWSVRHHSAEAGREMVRYGLELARAFPL